MVGLRPGIKLVQDILQTGMVGGGQAGKAQFIVPGVAAQHTGAFADELGRALAERAVQLACLAEPATAHTAAQNFHTGTVLHSTHHGHNKIFRRNKAVHVLHNGLGHAFRHTGAVRLDAFHPAIRQVGYIIEGRHIHAGNF